MRSSAKSDVDFITGIGSAPGEARERMLILVDINHLISSADLGLPDAELH